MKIKKSVMLRMRCSYGMIIFLIGVLISSLFISTDSSGWGPWTIVSPSHSGVEVRIKKDAPREGSKKCLWEVQFRNNYREEIVFGFGFTRAADRSECIIDHRWHVPAGKVSETAQALLDDSFTWYICVDGVEKR